MTKFRPHRVSPFERISATTRRHPPGTHLSFDEDGELSGPTGSWENNGRPSVETADGHKAWYLHGQLHRIGGPAVVYVDGSQGWYEMGQLHRDDGPARIWSDGCKAWYQYGQLHREYGPALVSPDHPDGLYFIYGHLISAESYSRRVIPADGFIYVPHTPPPPAHSTAYEPDFD